MLYIFTVIKKYKIHNVRRFQYVIKCGNHSVLHITRTNNMAIMINRTNKKFIEIVLCVSKILPFYHNIKKFFFSFVGCCLCMCHMKSVHDANNNIFNSMLNTFFAFLIFRNIFCTFYNSRIFFYTFKEQKKNTKKNYINCNSKCWLVPPTTIT